VLHPPNQEFKLPIDLKEFEVHYEPVSDDRITNIVLVLKNGTKRILGKEAYMNQGNRVEKLTLANNEILAGAEIEYGDNAILTIQLRTINIITN